MVPNTRDLVIERDDPNIPDWALDAVRGGTRIALEILEAERLPDRVRLVRNWISASDDGLDPCVSMHNDREIVISFPAVANPSYLGGIHPSRTMLERALAFCAGCRTTYFVLDGQEWAIPDWFRAYTLSKGSASSLETISRAVAAIASGFTMVSEDVDYDARNEAVHFFLERLYSITQREGMAAAWRGAIGRASRALMREVRFGEIPGRVHVFGDQAGDPTDFIRLILYVGGEAPWPFAPRAF